MQNNSNMAQAVSFHQQGQLEDADALYAKVLAAEPKHSEALRLRGILARQMGNVPLSLELLEAASKADQYDGDALCELALSHMALGQRPCRRRRQ